jgi:hypothetical protein
MDTTWICCHRSINRLLIDGMSIAGQLVKQFTRMNRIEGGMLGSQDTVNISSQNTGNLCGGASLREIALRANCVAGG